MENGSGSQTYWEIVWKRYTKRPIGIFALGVILVFTLVGIYAPLLASSKPLAVKYDGMWFFPLFRYLFYPGFYTKPIDIFFNVLMFLFPFFLGLFWVKNRTLRFGLYCLLSVIQLIVFAYLMFARPKDPAADLVLSEQRQEHLQEGLNRFSWSYNLSHLSPYAKLNLLLRHRQAESQDARLQHYRHAYSKSAFDKWTGVALRERKTTLLRAGTPLPSDEELKLAIVRETPEDVIATKVAMPTLWQTQKENEEREIARLQEEAPHDPLAAAQLQYILDKREWLETEGQQLSFEVMPLIRHFHWEDDAGGEQMLNQYIPWWELTRINRKDLVAALIFGVRISLVVGILAVGISLLIAIPVGAYAGYYGGTFDIIVSRLLEVWESMPTFFMLLMIIAFTQSKSIFLVILMIGFFGWTGFSRYMRGEFFKQRNLPYVEAGRALGFSNPYIMFSHILPNAIPPLLTLLPFAMMGAITSEAGLSFLGLGEEGSSSWGVLMDEGRSAFPAESYLLWPPAVLLTLLLVAIAIVGDTMRDALDPKMQ